MELAEREVHTLWNIGMTIVSHQVDQLWGVGMDLMKLVLYSNFKEMASVADRALNHHSLTKRDGYPEKKANIYFAKVGWKLSYDFRIGMHRIWTCWCPK